MTTQIALFAKDPLHGACKTRLAQGIGQEAATAYYQETLKILLSRFADLSVPAKVVVYLAPTDSIATFATRFACNLEVRPQCSGNLGERLSQAFQDSPGDCLVIGSDMPELKEEHIQKALQALKTHDVTMGPCPDGGYYLLGAHQYHPALFQDMPWSTSDLQDATREAVRQEGLSFVELPELSDVDYLEDLQALAARLPHADPMGPAVHRALAALPKSSSAEC